MKFLSVRSDICRQLPSDSTSRWTPLPLTMQFPLLGLARDFHPLDNAHAERTPKKVCHNLMTHLFLYSQPITETEISITEAEIYISAVELSVSETEISISAVEFSISEA